MVGIRGILTAGNGKVAIFVFAQEADLARAEEHFFVTRLAY